MRELHNHLEQPVGFPVPNWQPCPLPPKTMMVGRTCRIEPLDPAVHARPLFEANRTADDDSNWTYMGYGSFDSFEVYRSWCESVAGGDDPLFLAIVDAQTEQAVGLASYLRINPQMGVIEVGHIHFSPLLQRTVAATEAMYLMMRRVFDELGYRRYEWKCDALNEPSRKAALRLGFTYEGTFRQAVVYKGRNRDTAWFSIIDEEWLRLKVAFEGWLDEGNFAEDGKQKVRLTDFINVAAS